MRSCPDTDIDPRSYTITRTDGTSYLRPILGYRPNCPPRDPRGGLPYKNDGGALPIKGTRISISGRDPQKFSTLKGTTTSNSTGEILKHQINQH